ncbi:hypothetical protein D9M68_981550 [compost metagenome]
MLLSPAVSQTPSNAENTLIGTIRMTESGRVRLSYWAASTSRTSNTQSGKIHKALFPAMICW